MVSQNSIQEILGKINIIDVISDFVSLKKRGANYLGVCPFHNEKTPSFTVSPAKEIYKCFGCGRSGNTVSFIMEHEKYGYIEAMKWLANRYGIEIEETYTSNDERQHYLTSDSLFIINQFAQNFFADQLFNTDEGRNIGLSYFKERGFREDIITKFQLGYSPEKNNAFATTAIENKFDTTLLVKTGLIVNRNDQYLDNYRNRVIFPIHNQSGKVMGFGARSIVSNTNAPKYINTPENEIYVKSKILYGVYFARQAIDKADECLLVEGYTDVVSLHQAGIENVVASGGTSLTEDQLRLIKKYTNYLTIIYDGDAAGIKAAMRGLGMALENALHVNLVLLPENEDPDSYVHKVGADAFKLFIEKNKKDFVLFQLEVSMKDIGTNLNRKVEVVNTMAETIAKINKVEEFTKQQDYIKRCAELLQIDEEGFHHLVNKYIGNKISALEKKSAKADTEATEEKTATTNFDDASFAIIFNDELYEKELARVLIELGTKNWNSEKSIAAYVLEEIPDESLIEFEPVKKIIAIFKQHLSEAKAPPEKSFFIYHPDVVISTLAVSLLHFPYEQSEHWVKDFDKAAGFQQSLFENKFEDFMNLVKDENVGELNKYLNTQKDNTLVQVSSALSYLKLRKIKQMITQNLKDIEDDNNSDNLQILLKTHEHLKEMEKSLTEKFGTVIYK